MAKVFMPSKRQAKVKTLTAKIDDDELVFTYRPALITPAMIDEFQSASDEAGHRQLATQLVRFIASWEIGEPRYNGHVDPSGNPLPELDENGEMILDRWPVDYEHMERLDVGVLRAIATAIGNDLTPGEATAGDSSAG